MANSSSPTVIFGGNALHKAAKAQKWVDFQTMARNSPELLIQRDEGHKSPLHLAICHGAPPTVIVNTLKNIDARLARIKDREHNTLLHAAFEYGISHQAALALLRAQPQLATTQKNLNDQTPLDILKASKPLSGWFGGAADGVLTWVYYKDEYEAVCQLALRESHKWQEGYIPDPSEQKKKVEAYVGVPVEPHLNEAIGAEYMFSITN